MSKINIISICPYNKLEIGSVGWGINGGIFKIVKIKYIINQMISV